MPHNFQGRYFENISSSDLEEKYEKAKDKKEKKVK
jgi:hypothetical protein